MAILGEETAPDGQPYESFKVAATNGQPLLAMSYLIDILDELRAEIDGLKEDMMDALAKTSPPVVKAAPKTAAKKKATPPASG